MFPALKHTKTGKGRQMLPPPTSTEFSKKVCSDKAPFPVNPPLCKHFSHTFPISSTLMGPMFPKLICIVTAGVTQERRDKSTYFMEKSNNR